MNRLVAESQKLTFDGKRFRISTRNLQNYDLHMYSSAGIEHNYYLSKGPVEVKFRCVRCCNLRH